MASRRYRQAFASWHTILPVIHVESGDQAIRNARLARAAGCDGVFLINHGLAADRLFEIHRVVHGGMRDWWIGLNCLGMDPAEVFERIDGAVAGVWADDAGIDERQSAQPTAEAVLAARNRTGWQGLYFGGVAFKYCRQVEDLEGAARIARAYMDVVTTSGPGTGQAASPQKIRRMRAALGDFPLAIASGITPENVKDYLGVADCFLVATGISKSFTELDPARVKALVQTVRGYAPGNG